MLTAYDITGEQYHHTREDVDTLHKLGHMLPDYATIVNIGACFGTSTLALAECSWSSVIFSIDIKECPEERDHLNQAGIEAGRVYRILGSSQVTGKYWPLKVDLVFVDGAHDLQSVRTDIENWKGHIKPDGIIAIHDYGAPSLPNVKQAVDECCAGWNELLHIGTIKAFRK